MSMDKVQDAAAEAREHMEIFKQVLRHELYGFLVDNRDILDLLFEREISPKKAAEALTERKLGFTPRLPEPALRSSSPEAEQHYHQAFYEGEKLTRECALCHRDLTDDVHIRGGLEK